MQGISPVDNFQGVDELLLVRAEALVGTDSAGKESVAAIGGLLQHVQRHPLGRDLHSHDSMSDANDAHVRNHSPSGMHVLSCMHPRMGTEGK